MATLSIAGTVTGGKDGTPAVTLRTLDSGTTLAEFSVADRQYAGKDNERGQFYKCSVFGKLAEIAADRLQRGSKVAVTGQLVQTQDREKRVYYEVRNSQITFLEPREQSSEEEVPF